VIPQRLALEWGLTKLDTDAIRITGVTQAHATVYGAYSLRFALKDSWNRMELLQDTVFGIDRQRKGILLGMPFFEKHNLHLFPQARQWRYAIESARVELAEVQEFAQLLEQGEQVYTLQGFYRPDQEENRFHAIIEEVATDPQAPRWQNEIEALRTEFQEVFWQEEKESQFAPCEGVEHAIETTSEPPFGPIYNLSGPELQALRVYLEDSLRKGWITQSESPAGAPILFVPKKDGGLRLCVDYRGLNKVTIKNRHPLPLISEILDRLSGAKIFTKIDLKDAYHRIRIRRSDRWKTAFRTRYGHFEYVVMPFGLTNAPATFQAYIHKALAGMLDTICIVYLDDILIFSEDPEAHTQHVRQVFTRLSEYQLYANPSKCAFFVRSVEFLGYIISDAGVSMDQSRVTAILEWPTPKNHKEVQIFLGFTNFYRRFIDKYSQIAGPLSSLLKGGKEGKYFGPFLWDTGTEQAFRKLRDAFAQAPLLAHFDPLKKSRVETDASDYALAAVYSQKQEDGHWHPIAFYSRKMQGAELAYQTHDKELLAIVVAIKHWRHYLEGAEHAFDVLTDHDNLVGFSKQKSLNGRQARWAIALSAYDFQVIHRPGKSNPADAPSRRPDYAGETQTQDTWLPALREKLRLRETGPVEGSKLVDLEPIEVSNYTVRHKGVRRGKNHPQGVQHASSTGDAGEELDALDLILIDRAERQSLNRRQAMEVLQFELQEDADSRTGPSNTLLELVAMHQKTDPRSRNAASSPSNLKGKWTVQDGILYHDRRLYIPDQQALREEIMARAHDNLLAGHFGRERTRDLVAREYHWEGMNEEIQQYVQSCEVCQKTKAKRHRPYGGLVALPLPQGPLQEISMDFITDLPPSKRGASVFDAILVIVDRYTKIAAYIPTNKTVTAAELADLFMYEWVRSKGLPKGIVSDRGSVFTSAFWEQVCSAWGAKRRLSTAFHPQTDGQTERQNQTLKQYLRAFANDEQNNWASLLHLAEFAYNRSKHASLNCSPFFALYGADPRLEYHAQKEGELSTPTERVKRIAEVREGLEKRWTDTVRKMEKSHNIKRQDASFAPGERVMLATKNLRLKFPSRTLSPRYLGPLVVREAVGKNAYRLSLPTGWKIHDVVNIERLEKYHARSNDNACEMPGSVLVDEEEEWEVDKILAKRRRKGETQYLVRWLGWGPEYDQWVNKEDLHAEELVPEFEARQQSKRHAKKKQ